MTTEEKILDVKRQLSNPKISGPRKRDLTKYLWRLNSKNDYLYCRPDDRNRGS